MSSRSRHEGAENITLKMLLPIRDFVMKYGIQKSPGRDQMSISLELDSDLPKFIIDVQTTRQCLSMRITLGDDTSSDQFQLLTYEGEGNHLFLGTEVNPTDIITLSMVIQIEMACSGDEKVTLH